MFRSEPTRRRDIMGIHVNRPSTTIIAWACATNQKAGPTSPLRSRKWTKTCQGAIFESTGGQLAAPKWIVTAAPIPLRLLHTS